MGTEVRELATLQMIVRSLANDNEPFDHHGDYSQARPDPSDYWECRYCRIIHAVKRDLWGWPIGYSRLAHEAKCPWYWAQFWSKQQATIAQSTPTDPRQTKPTTKIRRKAS